MPNLQVECRCRSIVTHARKRAIGLSWGVHMLRP